LSLGHYRRGLGQTCCLIFLGLVACTRADQGKRPIVAIKTATPPVIDGDISDPCWKTAAVADGFTDVQNGAPVPDQTIVYLLYDDRFIYVAFDCRDSRPDGIVGRETVRDAKFNQTQKSNNPNNEDNVEVDFDPFLTFQGNDVSQFSVNAIGTRSAALAGGRASKAEWKGDWDAASKRTATGWTCEMRIPWASLNYPAGKKSLTMGIDFQRFQDRTKIWSMWSNVTAQGFINLEGLWTGVSPPQVAYHPVMSLLPYFLGGDVDNKLSGKVGLDARYTFTPQLTGVASIDPDFSTVQAAIQSIQFSHAERSLPELRPFFTEGGNDFSAQTNINDIGAFFYSNRIATFDAGAKLYGKLDPRDTLGFLDTYGLGGRNDLAARIVHSYSDTSSGGLMLVSTNADGVQNTNAIMDQHFRWGKFAFEGIGANSIGSGAGGGVQVLSTYYADKFLTSLVQVSEVSDNFLVPDGYVPYTGYKGFTGVEDWNAQWQHGALRSTELTVVPLDWRQMDGKPYFQGVQTSYNVETRSDWHLEFDYIHMDFMGSKDKTLGFNIVKGATNRFCQFGLQMATGEQGSIRSTYLSPTASVRLLKKLDILYQGAFQNRAGLQQQHVLTLNYELSPIRSFGGRIVANNADTNAYFFYHRSGGKGTEFYFIIGDPNATRTVRGVQVKFVFAFQS